MKKAKAKSKAKTTKKPAKRKPSKPLKKKLKVGKTKASAKKAKTVSKKKKKASTAKASPKPGVIAPPNSVLLGYVEDYFAKIGVIALTLKASVAIGQRIQILGHTTHFEQPVGSMQVDHAPVTNASSGDGIGIKVKDRARYGDHVYLLK